MKSIILVAGATGNLGSKIVKNLLELGAEVRVLARLTSNAQQLKELENLGAKIYKVDMDSQKEIQKACEGVSCVMSALAGLRDVIVDLQSSILAAAVAAGVTRFIPSDYSLDFTKQANGLNRNLDFRREFHAVLDKTPIKATTIFNGAFADMLTGQMPMILFDKNMVIHLGNADQKMDFTSVQSTAEFTARAALDTNTPRYLTIAGDELSARDIHTMVNELSGKKFRLFKTGSVGFLGVIIKIAKMFSSGEKDIYPAWQGMQYMHNMVTGDVKMAKLDNNRYPEMPWLRAGEILKKHLSQLNN
jgi:nucleoside-diphosphate-sugar epimerase